MPPHTTPTKKAKICTMKKAGYTNDEIRASLNGCHDITDRSINRIFKRYGEKENYYDVGQHSGRPKKLTDRDGRAALRHLANGTARNATELQQTFFPHVSVTTIKRELRRSGLEPHK